MRERERKGGDKETSNRLFLYIYNCSHTLVPGAIPFIEDRRSVTEDTESRSEHMSLYVPAKEGSVGS